MNQTPHPLHTAQVSAERVARARQRVSDPEWSWLVPEILQQLESKEPDSFPFPAYDDSWYRPDQPYSETYARFHEYVQSGQNRQLFALLRNRLLGGLILGEDAWRRQAAEMALRHGEAIDFRVQHYDAGMEYSQLGWLLCDVRLGASDLLSDSEQELLTRLLREVADAINLNLDYWRFELSRMAFSNHRICHMAVLLALGKVLGDASLVKPVYDREDERSFAHYLDGCLYDHGLCYESSTHYHFATSSFLLSAAMASEALGGEEENLFHLRGANGLGLRDIICAPAGICFSGQLLPRTGDTYGGDMSLDRILPQFLVARGVYGTDPLSGDLRPLISRHGLRALCWLREMPDGPVPEKPPLSGIFPEHGYGVLCQDRGLHRQAFLCGDASGIHHHREGLQLQAQIGDKLILATTELRPTSAHGFSDSIHERFNRHPFAHSQLEVDGLDQNLRPCPVPFRIWDPEGVDGVSRMAMVDDRGELVDGVAQGRFVFMAEDWICDCVFAASDRERGWRLFYHLPAGPAVHPDFHQVAADAGDPAPLMRVDAELPAGTAGFWESGSCRFTVSTLKEMTLRRFVIEENATRHGEGMVAETRGEVAAFITVMQPADNSCRIEALRLVSASGEWILRWRLVTSGGGRDLQARLKSAIR